VDRAYQGGLGYSTEAHVVLELVQHPAEHLPGPGILAFEQDLVTLGVDPGPEKRLQDPQIRIVHPAELAQDLSILEDHGQVLPHTDAR
jgi:hypothetical protein